MDVVICLNMCCQSKGALWEEVAFAPCLDFIVTQHRVSLSLIIAPPHDLSCNHGNEVMGGQGEGKKRGEVERGMGGKQSNEGREDTIKV